MKKDCNSLSICQPSSDSNTGDWSPHRSTVELKQWALDRGNSDTFSFGEPDTIFHQAMSLEQQQDQSYSIVMPSFRELTAPDQSSEIRFRCVSHDSLAATCHNCRDVEGVFAPMARKVSLEPYEAGSEYELEGASHQQLASTKRRRNSSLSEVFEGSRSMDEDFAPVLGKARKRRKLHGRKRAMDSSDFAAILPQIGF